MADFPFSNVPTIPRDLGAMKRMQACRVASTANVDPTSLASGGTMDAITLAVGDRILLKDQTDPSENGIWIVGSSSCTRSSDFNESSEINASLIVPILVGTANGGDAYTLDNPDEIVVVGTTELGFTQYTTWLAAGARTL